MITINQLADAIYIEEGGTHTKWPYGVHDSHLNHPKNPRGKCIDIIKGTMATYHITNIDHKFITLLSKRYCPVNHLSWEHNVCHILNIK